MSINAMNLSVDLPEAPEPSESKFRWGTVVSQFPTLAVRLDGDSAPIGASPNSLVDPFLLVVGTRVWCQLTDRRVILLGAYRNGVQGYQRRFSDSMGGGGVRTATSPSGALTPTISWSRRLVAIGVSKNEATLPSGYFSIEQPPAGTVIPTFNDEPASVVTAEGVPLPTWGSLWYLPIPGQGFASDPDRFRVGAYVGTDYEIPPDWILIAQTFADSGGTAVKWGDGMWTDVWRPLTLVNNWINHGNGFQDAGYMKDSNGIVHLRGLIKSGTTNHLGTLPERYRPGRTSMFATVSSSGHLRVDILESGAIIQNTLAAAFQSFDGITFDAVK